MYYDKKGNKITAEEWMKKMEDKDYRRIGLTKISDTITISTVWLGLSHNLGTGKPLIFETVAFTENYIESMERYATITEAKAGHEKFVNKYKTKGVKK